MATKVLDHIVRSIVDDPDKVRVEAIDDDGTIILEVRVGEGDLGRVIGRRGRTAQNIRALVRAAAEKDGVEVDVDFLDDKTKSTRCQSCASTCSAFSRRLSMHFVLKACLVVPAPQRCSTCGCTIFAPTPPMHIALLTMHHSVVARAW